MARLIFLTVCLSILSGTIFCQTAERNIPTLNMAAMLEKAPGPAAEMQRFLDEKLGSAKKRGLRFYFQLDGKHKLVIDTFRDITLWYTGSRISAMSFKMRDALGPTWEDVLKGRGITKVEKMNPGKKLGCKRFIDSASHNIVEFSDEFKADDDATVEFEWMTESSFTMEFAEGKKTDVKLPTVVLPKEVEAVVKLFKDVKWENPWELPESSPIGSIGFIYEVKNGDPKLDIYSALFSCYRLRVIYDYDYSFYPIRQRACDIDIESTEEEIEQSTYDKNAEKIKAAFSQSKVGLEKMDVRKDYLKIETRCESKTDRKTTSINYKFSTVLINFSYLLYRYNFFEKFNYTIEDSAKAAPKEKQRLEKILKKFSE